MFGLSLVELQKREKVSANSVPSVLNKMVERIKKGINSFARGDD